MLAMYDNNYIKKPWSGPDLSAQLSMLKKKRWGNPIMGRKYLSPL